MKHKKWLKIMVTVLLVIVVLLFPALIGLLLRLETWLLSSTEFEPIILITNTYEIEFGDYITSVIAFASCVCSAVIGYMAYRLSVTIQQYSEKQAMNQKRFAIDQLISEINYNSRIIKLCEDKIDHNYQQISLSAYGLLGEVSDIIDAESVNRLLELYKMFTEYQRNGQLDSKFKFQWISNNNCVNAADILNLLKEKRGNNR